MEFEKFVSKKTRIKGVLTISISKYGHIQFHANVNKLINDKKYAVLYYNKKEKLIGIKFSSKPSLEAYSINKYQRKSGAILSISFLKYYGILHKETKSYIAKWDEKEKMLIIDLKQRD